MIELVEFFIHRSYNHHNNRLITKQIFLFELTRALKINFENKFDIKKKIALNSSIELISFVKIKAIIIRMLNIQTKRKALDD